MTLVDDKGFLKDPYRNFIAYLTMYDKRLKIAV